MKMKLIPMNMDGSYPNWKIQEGTKRWVSMFNSQGYIIYWHMQFAGASQSKNPRTYYGRIINKTETEIEFEPCLKKQTCFIGD